MLEEIRHFFHLTFINPHVWGFLAGMFAKVIIACIMLAWFIQQIV